MIGAVLNGGRSTRMGSDKARVLVGDRTLLDLAVDLVRSVVGEVVVVGGPVAPSGVPLVPDLEPGSGPLGGLATALRHADGRDVLCMAVDLPLLTGTTLSTFARPLATVGEARLARTPGSLQPLCGAYQADLVALAEERLASRDRSMHAFLRAVPVLSLVDVPAGELLNVNRPGDVELASELAHDQENRSQPE